MRAPRWEHTWAMLEVDLGERASWCAVLEEASSPNRLDLWLASYFGEMEEGRRRVRAFSAITAVLSVLWEPGRDEGPGPS